MVVANVRRSVAASRLARLYLSPSRRPVFADPPSLLAGRMLLALVLKQDEFKLFDLGFPNQCVSDSHDWLREDGMIGKPDSRDLRKHVVAAIEAGCPAIRQATKQFGIAISASRRPTALLGAR